MSNEDGADWGSRSRETIELTDLRDVGESDAGHEHDTLRKEILSQGGSRPRSDTVSTMTAQSKDGAMDMRAFMSKFHMTVENEKIRSPGWGTLMFTGKRNAKPVPYVCLSTEDSAEDARDFVLNMMDQKYGVGYEQPSLILSITGGAQNFSLNHHLLSAITRGLRTTAERTHAWVVSGGTNTGVMKLTGQIMEKIGESSREPPIIGIASHGVIINHADMSKPGAPHIRYEYDATRKGAGICGLDENHNLFMLVDNGTVGKFGVEIAFRAKVEAAISEYFDAPVVTIVIQGGPGTLDTALKAVQAGTPCVVIDGSGQAADILAYAYNFLHSPLTKYSSYTHLGLKQLIGSIFKPDMVNTVFEKAMLCVENPDLVVVYNLQDQGPDELDECILEAIFGGKSTLKNKLKQAMYFDSIHTARKALEEEVKNSKKNSEAEIADIINDNLMAALINNKPSFVSLFLDHGALMHKLRPTEPFMKIVNEYNDKAQRASDGKKEDKDYPDMSTKPQYELAVEELYHHEAKKSHSYVATLVYLRQNAQLIKRGKGSKITKGDILKKRKVNVDTMEKILGSFVSKRYNSKHDASETDPAKLEIIASHMLFFWAVCLDKFRMARIFWDRGDRSIINALAASRILNQLARHDALQGPHLSDDRKKMLHNSEKFEALAVGVLDECFDTDSDLTSLMLHEKSESFNGNAITVSFEADSLAFLSHRATQAVLNEDWYGQLSTLTKGWRVGLCYLFPILVPMLLSLRERSPQSGEDDIGTVEYFRKTEDRESEAKEPSFIAKTYRLYREFYTAPFTRFFSDLYGHFALCLLFSYYVIDDVSDTLSIVEIVLALWFAVLIAEETRQVLGDGWGYFYDLWNQFDVVMLLLYIAGFIIRITQLDVARAQIISHAVHAVDAIILWLRFSRYYAVSEVLGPKLIMMATMMRKDVLTFVMLLLIFMIGFGVASQSLLFPTIPFDEHSFAGIFFRPYYQIYGELFLEDINDESGCIGSLPFSSCGDGKVAYLMPFLLGLYILVTNILLVNLLIAMFNDTYISIQDSAEKLWRKQNYELLLEYRDRPPIPAPLIIIAHVQLILEWFFSCFTRDSGDDDELSEDRLRRLHNFQEAATERYLRDEERSRGERVEALVESNSHGISQVNKVVSSMQEFLTTFRQSSERQLTTIKGQLTDIATAVVADDEADLLSMTNVDGVAPGSTTSMGRSRSGTLGRSLTTSRFSEDYSILGKDGEEAGSIYIPPLEYPGFPDKKRFPLSAKQASPDNALPNYRPTDFTASFVLKGPIWADPNDPKALRFNERTEGEKAVDRTTCHPTGRYDVNPSTNIPLNPFGRTGMVGRGVLGKWGVNQAADTVVTRWKRAKNNTILERDGRKVLEFVAVERADNGMWAIPGGFVDDGESRTKTTSREFMEEAMRVNEADYASLDDNVKESLNRVFSRGKIVARIYSEDPRNTDNAWIETTCVNFHDDTGNNVEKLILKGGDDAVAAKWMIVHGDLNLFASHKKLLQLVAEYHHAYF